MPRKTDGPKNVGDLARLNSPDWSRIGRKSKNKGNRFENHVAQILDDWFYPAEKKFLGAERIIRRTPMSGGWCKTGDIQVNPMYRKKVCSFPFHVETKKVQGWTLEAILANGWGDPLKSWWEQCLGDAEEGVIPMLVFARNGIEPLCMLRMGDYTPNQSVSHGHLLLMGIRVVIFSLEDLTSGDPAVWGYHVSESKEGKEKKEADIRGSDGTCVDTGVEENAGR